MSSQKVYDNPAVFQALVDIRFAPPAADSAPLWDDFEVPAYLTKQLDEYAHKFHTEAEGSTLKSHNYEAVPSSRIWSTPDQRESWRFYRHGLIVLHNRTDGEAGPVWPVWSERLASVKDACRRLRRLAESPKVSRVGVRYINRFDLPEKEAPLTRYFRTLPDMSADMPGRSISRFLMQMEIPQETEGVSVQVVMATVPPEEMLNERVGIYVDIDAFRQFSDVRDLDDHRLFQVLDELHDVENAAFESFLTAASRKLMMVRDETQEG